jgi:membrane fusion protein, multidrug efflux system
MATSHSQPQRPARRWALMLIGVVVVFGGVFAAKAFFTSKANAFFDNMPQPASAVSAELVELQNWSESSDAVGTFLAVNGTDITTESGGVVREILFEAGQSVNKGAVLVRLNTANEEASLKALEASAKLARTQADRWQQLGKDNLVSLDEVQSKLTAAATAQAQVEAQRALIAQKTIRAPFSGVLGIRKINLGQYIAPGAAIVSLQQLDPIYLDFNLPEQLTGKMVEGTSIQARVDAMPGEVFDGQVTAIEPMVDPSTRNFKTQATLRNPEGKLRPGSFAKVAFDLGNPHDVLVIPQTAVSFNPYGNSVFVIETSERQPGEMDMKGNLLTGKKLIVNQRFIKTGAARGDLIAVTSGLKAGEQIATSGLLKLRNGAEVTINNDVKPANDAAPQVENR